MDTLDFKNRYLSKSFGVISNKQKETFVWVTSILMMFNIIIDINKYWWSNDVLDSLASNSSSPCILQPTMKNSYLKPLSDDTFPNLVSHEIIFGVNITVHLFDHLPQFLLVSNILSNQKI